MRTNKENLKLMNALKDQLMDTVNEFLRDNENEIHKTDGFLIVLSSISGAYVSLLHMNDLNHTHSEEIKKSGIKYFEETLNIVKDCRRERSN